MFVANIASLASLVVARETHFPWILAKLAIFATDILGKIVQNFILNIFAIICFVKMLLV